jgi:hypothetical protein
MVKISILVFLHLVADFLLQGSYFSKLKATKITYLLLHVLIYTLLFVILSPLLLSLTFTQGLLFSGINGGIHLVVDFLTSKLKQKFWQKNESIYVAIITFDALIHIAVLIATYIYIFPEAFNAYLNLSS